MSSSIGVVRRRLSIAGLLAIATAVAVVLAMLAIGTPRADAGSTDAPWTGAGTGEEDGRLTVASDGTDGYAEFNYNLPDSSWDDDDNDHQYDDDDDGELIDGDYFTCCGVGEWTFETVAAAPGVRVIDWTYAGFHAWYQVTVGLEAYVSDGVTETVVSLVDDGPVNCCAPPSGGFSYSGTTTLEVQTGDVFGFRMSGSNYDSNGTLEGTLSLDIAATDAFTVSVNPADASVVAGDTTSISGEFTSLGGTQSLDLVRAQLSTGLSYVPGSSAVVAGGEGAPIPDPVVDGDQLVWQPVGGFTIDGETGLTLRFDVAVDPDYETLNEGLPPGVVDVLGVAGTLEAGGSGSFEVTNPPTGTVVLGQAVPLESGTLTGIVGTLATTPATAGTLYVNYAETCVDGELGEAASSLGTFEIPADEDGNLFFALAIDNSQPVTTGYITASFGIGPESQCIVVGPDNDSWTRALPVPLAGGTGTSTGFIDQPGVSRWYKFSVAPGAAATVTLSDLPADYDLAVFKDIAQAYEDLTNPLEDLNRLSAEFAPSVFSPSVFSPSVFSPSVFSPDAYSPSVFSPSVFSPRVLAFSVLAFGVFSLGVLAVCVQPVGVFAVGVLPIGIQRCRVLAVGVQPLGVLAIRVFPVGLQP